MKRLSHVFPCSPASRHIILIVTDSCFLAGFLFQLINPMFIVIVNSLFAASSGAYYIFTRSSVAEYQHLCLYPVSLIFHLNPSYVSLICCFFSNLLLGVVSLLLL